jgi:hypothetical protein
MKLDKNRVLRTLVQSAAGAGIALITTITANFSREALIAAGIQFVGTVVVAVLMNIKKQAEEQAPPEDME